jgi:hypothetical protein
MTGSAWLQCADVIVAQGDSPDAARPLTAAILDRHPGCVVAVVRHEGGRWCVLGIRDRTPVTLEAPADRRITGRAAVGLGWLGYACWIMSRAG